MTSMLYPFGPVYPPARLPNLIMSGAGLTRPVQQV